MLQMLRRRTAANAYLFLALTMLLWAGNHVVGRWASGQIPPMTLAFLRWSGAAALIVPFALGSLRSDRSVIRSNIPRLLLLGFLGSGIYNTLQYIALTGTTVTNAAILNSWAPVLIATAGALLFRDHLPGSQMAGLAMSLTGVLAIILHGEPARLANLDFNHGDLVMLAGTLIWAAYTTLLRLRPAISTMSFAAITYTVAGFINLPLAGYEYANGQRIVWSGAAIAAILYTAVLASLLAYFLYTRSVEIIGATRTGAFIHLIPFFASIMAILFLGEQPTPYHAVGFGLILAGVWLASRGR